MAVQQCNHVWARSSCPVAATCVPYSQHSSAAGFCSCEHVDSTLNNHWSADSTGDGLSLSCQRSGWTWTIILCDSLIGLAAILVTIFFGRVVYKAKRAGDFRWDLPTLSAVVLLCSSLCLTISRVLRSVLLSASLTHSAAAYYGLVHVYTLFAVAVMVFAVSGCLFFAITTMSTLKNASQLMGITPANKGSAMKQARLVGVGGGLFVAIAMSLCVALGEPEYVNIVVAVSAMAISTSLFVLTRSLSFVIRTHPAQQHQHLRTPVLRIVSTLTTRLQVVMMLLTANGILSTVLAEVGKAKRSAAMLGLARVIVSTAQFAIVLLLLFSVLLSLRSIWAAKQHQRMLQKHPDLQLANRRPTIASSQRTGSLASLLPPHLKPRASWSPMTPFPTNAQLQAPAQDQLQMNLNRRSAHL